MSDYDSGFSNRKSRGKLRVSRQPVLDDLSPENEGGTPKKGPWTPEEDAMLLHLVHENGPKEWTVIASKIGGRVGKQCRERYYNHLAPDVRKDAWTEEEDALIIKLHMTLGNKWTDISRMLNGRPANAIKNRWNSTLKRRATSDADSPVVGKRAAAPQTDDDYAAPPRKKQRRQHQKTHHEVAKPIMPQQPVTTSTTGTSTDDIALPQRTASASPEESSAVEVGTSPMRPQENQDLNVESGDRMTGFFPSQFMGILTEQQAMQQIKQIQQTEQLASDFQYGYYQPVAQYPEAVNMFNMFAQPQIPECRPQSTECGRPPVTECGRPQMTECGRPQFPSGWEGVQQSFDETEKGRSCCDDWKDQYTLFRREAISPDLGLDAPFGNVPFGYPQQNYYDVQQPPAPQMFQLEPETSYFSSTPYNYGQQNFGVSF